MKITKSQLRKIIREEIQKEAFGDNKQGGGGHVERTPQGRTKRAAQEKDPNAKFLGTVGGIGVTRTKAAPDDSLVVKYDQSVSPAQPIPFKGEIEKYPGYPKSWIWNRDSKQYETVDKIPIPLKDSAGKLRIPDAEEYSAKRKATT